MEKNERDSSFFSLSKRNETGQKVGMAIQTCSQCGAQFQIHEALLPYLHTCNPCSLRPAPEKDADAQPAMPKQVWQRVVNLCHPDRHTPGTSQHSQAVEATQWLLANKPKGRG